MGARIRRSLPPPPSAARSSTPPSTVPPPRAAPILHRSSTDPPPLPARVEHASAPSQEPVLPATTWQNSTIVSPRNQRGIAQNPPTTPEILHQTSTVPPPLNRDLGLSAHSILLVRQCPVCEKAGNLPALSALLALRRDLWQKPAAPGLPLAWPPPLQLRKSQQLAASSGPSPVSA